MKNCSTKLVTTGRQKFAALLVSFAMAFSMAACAPALAFAADTPEGGITSLQTPEYPDFYADSYKLVVKPNTRTYVVEAAGVHVPLGMHAEFGHATGTGGSINLRGYFTSLAKGESTIMVYLHNGSTIAPTPGKDPAIDSLSCFSIQITVDPGGDFYTYQGVNGQGIMMTNPTVNSISVVSGGYIDGLANVVKDIDGNLYFNISMLSGYGKTADDFQEWLTYNKPNLIFTCEEKGIEVDATNPNIQITPIKSELNTDLQIKINAYGLGLAVGDECSLLFGKNFSGHKTTKNLGLNVRFDFTI